ncbi:MAG: hypothetical protein ACI4XQ_06320 [Eubacteriales bacterium]
MLGRNSAAEKDRIRVSAFMQKKCEQMALDDHRVPKELSESAAAPLPNGAPGCMCRTSDGAVWIGNANGLTRTAFDGDPRDKVQFFAAPRYLADNRCVSLLPDGNGVWVRTETGVSHIWYEEMTYAGKAAVYDGRILSRQTRHGFVSEPHFDVKGDFDHFKHYSSDNDGLWTAMYAAGACYEYAVTGSEDSLKRAVTTVNAVLDLVDVTGRPGYPARSYILRGEKLPEDGFWVPYADGSLTWKSDTSSDELVGHFLIYLIAYELLPDENIRGHIRRVAAEICDGILANGCYLIDVTGRPTRWGRWSLEYFNGKGYSDASLNSAELLSFLKVTAHVTGEERFAEAYRRLAVDEGYSDIVCKYLERREEINYSDEELCYLSYLPLVILEEDEELRAKYREGMGQWCQNIRREANPLWTYIYKLIAPDEDFDMDSCLWTLRRLPLDMRYSDPAIVGRADIEYEQELDRFNKRQIKNLLPPDERRIMKWNGNPFAVETGGNILSEEPGTVYTLPYWLGRYYGFIVEEN